MMTIVVFINFYVSRVVVFLFYLFLFIFLFMKSNLFPYSFSDV